MTVKGYLSQAYKLDQQIDSKCEQVFALRALATKATAALGGMPNGGRKDPRSMETIICRLADMEAEINADIDRLLDIKQETKRLIAAVDKPIYRIILELRYLCYKPWCEIADRLGYDPHYLLKLHGKALREVNIPTDSEKKIQKDI